MRNWIVLFTSLLLLNSCSMFSAVDAGPSNTYLINVHPQPATKKSAHSLNVLVTQPEASSLYNTVEIAYTLRPYQIAYLSKSAWAETPPQMLQPLIISTLQRTHYFHAVGTPSDLSQYQYVLNTRIVKLEQDFAHLPTTVRFVLQARIVDTTSNRVIASKEFAASECMNRDSTYSGIQATNRAVDRVLLQLAQFSLKNMR